jgi:hypothetical protein
MLDIKPSSCSVCWNDDHIRASENETKILIRNNDDLQLVKLFGQLPSGNTQSKLLLNKDMSIPECT